MHGGSFRWPLLTWRVCHNRFTKITGSTDKWTAWLNEGAVLVYRVIQWGAGANGSALIRGVAAHADLELVACRVYDPVKDGVDAGVLAGTSTLGVPASTDRQRVIDTDADVVLFCPRQEFDPSVTDADIVDLLRSGKDVISVTGAHSFPAAIPGYAEQFEEACRVGGSTFSHGGINPGFIAERFAPVVTGICTDVTSVTVRESFNSGASTQSVVESMGFGSEIKNWTTDTPVGRMFDRLFVQLIHHLASSLGVELSHVTMSVTVHPAPHDITLPSMVVRQGTVAGIELRWEGVPVDPDQVVVAKETRWVCSDDLPGLPVQSGWQVAVEGVPSLLATIQMTDGADLQQKDACMVGAAIPMIPEVVAAPPGIHFVTTSAPFRKRF